MRISGFGMSEYEQEPTIEVGKDPAKFWWRVLVVVIVGGIILGYVASVSYVQYPYTVSVKGTFTSSDGSRATLIGLVECDAWMYQQCPDPGEQPVYECFAPPVMNLTQYCVDFSLEAAPGQYNVTLRNGEDYMLAGFLANSQGGFDKVCFVKIVLSPQVKMHTVTQDFSC